MLVLIYRIILFVKRQVEEFQKFQLKQGFAECGKNVDIHVTCNITSVDKIKIGSNSSVGSFTTIFGGFGVIIGSNCLISSGCGISSVNHVKVSHDRRSDATAEASGSRMIIIGNNVWIGMNVCILPGVTIGNNSIVGAGSVVTKSIPANEVWVGNPARFAQKLSF